MPQKNSNIEAPKTEDPKAWDIEEQKVEGMTVANDVPGVSSKYKQTKIVDGIQAGQARLDASTEALEVISYVHHEVHAGNMFEYTVATDLALNNVWDVQITTPNTTKWAHMTGWFQTESETNWWLWENVTINTPGTAVTEINCNRNSTTTATTTLASITNTSLANANSDTAVAGATELMSGISGAGKDSGSGPDREEIILKQNEDYSFRFEAAAAGYVSLHLIWYEHTDRN